MKKISVECCSECPACVFPDVDSAFCGLADDDDQQITNAELIPGWCPLPDDNSDELEKYKRAYEALCAKYGISPVVADGEVQ